MAHIEAWRIAFRELVAHLQRVNSASPDAADAALGGLIDALRRDDTNLIQGTITFPPPYPNAMHLPMTGCDPVVFLGRACGLIEAGPRGITVGQAERWFADVLFTMDALLGAPRSFGWFCNWWDDTPRPEARALLIPEVEYALDPSGGDPAPEGRSAELAVPASEPCPF